MVLRPLKLVIFRQRRFRVSPRLLTSDCNQTNLRLNCVRETRHSASHHTHACLFDFSQDSYRETCMGADPLLALINTYFMFLGAPLSPLLVQYYQSNTNAESQSLHIPCTNHQAPHLLEGKGFGQQATNDIDTSSLGVEDSSAVSALEGSVINYKQACELHTTIRRKDCKPALEGQFLLGIIRRA